MVRPCCRYVSPLKPSYGRSAVELPTDPKAIVEELAKQEFLLSHLHDEIKSGISDPQKEEQLWDVQRLVTQLKRELKALKRRNDSALDEFDHEPGPCLEMFEEKHLIAVEMELRSRIESEQGTIDHLLDQINELRQNPLSLHADSETASLTVCEEKVWADKYEELENQTQMLTERIISERQKCVLLLAQVEMLSLANRNRKSSSYLEGLQY
uniref:BMERB domain-containing protein n=1 Tax=Trichuris muris TaxID=70415 RepID=A0A5S6Q6C8_TRIMR